jgi:D-3-phosphoglycerate dehydrogenase
MKVFVSTHPFGSVSTEPLDILREKGIEVELNPYGRKIKPEELTEHLQDKDCLIAGTEKLDKEVFDLAPGLKIIARVGIGLDGIDFDELNERGILLTYTPEAVSRAVAELTVANMLNLARSIHKIHLGMKSGVWSRIIGFELSGKKIGIIGFGRVGQLVAKLLQGFSCELLVNDIAPDEEIGSKYNVTFCSKEEIYKKADIITLHVPKTSLTMNLIDEKALVTMKKTACLINTSRGGIVNETDLYNALKNGDIAAAALDVYEIEPYIAGQLCQLDNVLLTCHSGSCSREARQAMELQAAKEIVRFFDKLPPLFPVTQEIMKMEQAEKVVPINAEWHELLNISEEKKDERYRQYRKRWGQYPTYSIVGLYPLNLDLELICNANLIGMSLVDWATSIPAKDSCLMNLELYSQIMDEIKTVDDPVAVKFGFRGDPLFHPHFVEMLYLAKKTGCIETIATTKNYDIDEDLIKELIDKQLDVLNIFIPWPRPSSNQNETVKQGIDKLCQKLDTFKRYKAMAGVAFPKIKLFTQINPDNTPNLNEFTAFWRHWADVVAFVDPEIENDTKHFPNRNIKWACSRLWQRLVITYDGNFLLCNYDYQESCVLGKFPDMSIRQAWNSEKINLIRQLHKKDRSNEITPCVTCQFRKIEISKLQRLNMNG